MLAKLKEDAGLRDKLQVAADLDAAGAIAKEAGFDVTKADWPEFHQASPAEMSDGDLEGAAGGGCVGGSVRLERCVAGTAAYEVS